MPTLLLERLPLPNLKTYTTLSVVLLACAIYYANQVAHLGSENQDVARISKDDVAILAEHVASEKLGDETSVEESPEAMLNSLPEIFLQYNLNISLKNGSFGDRIAFMAYVLTREPWCLVTLTNMAYCCLLLVGRLIQSIVFGRLRVGEQQHIKDKFWNFVFYKFIFIFGVMNVQDMYEIVLWSTWFSVLGFLHILAQLCKDRFEYLSSSPATPARTHVKVLLLLGSIHLTCFALLVGCVTVGVFYTGFNTFAFIAAECLLLIIRTLYVLVRYGIHLWDMHHDSVWENRAIYIYYSELIFELSALFVDFSHHLHMLVWGNIFLSMASLVICMQLRFLFYEFQRRMNRYRNYRRVVNTMESKFPSASAEQLLRNNDDCAICWEKMESACNLPCGHMFHKACLRSWLEQDTSCPTCRISLNELKPVPPVVSRNATSVSGGVGAVRPDAVRPRPLVQPRFTDRFHFDGSRYVSWLPSFSVEVTHTQLLGRQQQRQQLTSQLDNMARSVVEVFPDLPMSIILEDLRVTKSVEVTIENIVEGRLVAPPIFTNDLDDDLLVDDSHHYSRPFVGDHVRPTDPPSAQPSNPPSDNPPTVMLDINATHSDKIQCDVTKVEDVPNLIGSRRSSFESTEMLLEDLEYPEDVHSIDAGLVTDVGMTDGPVLLDTLQQGAAAVVSDTVAVSGDAVVVSNVSNVAEEVMETDVAVGLSSSSSTSTSTSARCKQDCHTSSFVGSTFFTSSAEREDLLNQRKTELIMSARRKFISKNSSSDTASIFATNRSSPDHPSEVLLNQSSNTIASDVVIPSANSSRRPVAFNAIQHRHHPA